MNTQSFPPTYDSTIDAIIAAYPNFNETLKREFLARMYRNEDEPVKFEVLKILQNREIHADKLSRFNPAQNHKETGGRVFLNSVAPFIRPYLATLSYPEEKYVNLYLILEHLCNEWGLDLQAALYPLALNNSAMLNMFIPNNNAAT